MPQTGPGPLLRAYGTTQHTMTPRCHTQASEMSQRAAATLARRHTRVGAAVASAGLACSAMLMALLLGAGIALGSDGVPSAAWLLAQYMVFSAAAACFAVRHALPTRMSPRACVRACRVPCSAGL